MRVPRVHVGDKLAVGAELELVPAQAHYLKNVLRLRSGAAIILFDGRRAIDFRATLVLTGKRVGVRIEAETSLNNESALATQIIQGLVRADRVDWSVQKATELGVGQINLFNAEFTQTPIKPPQRDKKLAHWQGIARSACAQCGRAIVPEISFHNASQQAMAKAGGELRLLLDFDAPAISSVLPSTVQSVSLLIGPEGGLSPAEILIARDLGFRPARLGPRVLRSETAACAALAIVQSHLGDL